MDDQSLYNIAEAKMHLSRLIERVERGEQITIARNNRPVAIVSPVAASAADVLARIDGVRKRIDERISGDTVAPPHESLRDLVDAGRRLP
jgi:prevent-host-death family protein